MEGHEGPGGAGRYIARQRERGQLGSSRAMQDHTQPLVRFPPPPLHTAPLAARNKTVRPVRRAFALESEGWRARRKTPERRKPRAPVGTFIRPVRDALRQAEWDLRAA